MGGHSVADSVASTSFSRTPGGASTQPTRSPDANVFENEPRYTTLSGSSERSAG